MAYHYLDINGNAMQSTISEEKQLAILKQVTKVVKNSTMEECLDKLSFVAEQFDDLPLLQAALESSIRERIADLKRMHTV
jgi:hypothetical protein